MNKIEIHDWIVWIVFIIIAMIIAGIVTMIIAGSLFSIGWGLEIATCDAKTIDIGFSHRYSIMGGCQIEVEENKWIPLELYYFKQE